MIKEPGGVLRQRRAGFHRQTAGLFRLGKEPAFTVAEIGSGVKLIVPVQPSKSPPALSHRPGKGQLGGEYGDIVHRPFPPGNKRFQL
jgi:hypothetical protein